jgi:hypothetical protein
VVVAAEMEGVAWDTFVRQERERRGLASAVAANSSKVYKKGRDGKHLAKPFSILVATLRELYGDEPVCITDVVIANVVSQNISSEASTMALLSGIRVIARKAFGELECLKYDKESTEQLKAQAKEVRAKRPRYSHASVVDFGRGGKVVSSKGDDGAAKDEEDAGAGVWMSMVKERREVDHLPDTSTRKLRVIRNHAIFLRRHDSISRSDCEFKNDARMEEYHRVYDEAGDLQTQARLSRQLGACVVGDGGSVQMNYKDPKDPRKTGEWSDTVEVRPLRLHLLVNPAVPWLVDVETVAFLCVVRVQRDYHRCMEEVGWSEKVPQGHTWTYVTANPFDMKGKLQPLLPDTIGGLVKKRAAAGGLKVNSSEETGAKDTRVALAGHFLRGHAGSIAYELAVHEGAHWDPLLGVDRARHTLGSFLKHYSRGVAPRIVTAFRRHEHRETLRFEEASRL